MAQLKPSFVSEISNTLSGSPFTSEDFDIQLLEEGKSLVKIVFLHNPEYFLECSETHKKEKYTVTQKYTMESREEFRHYSTINLLMAPGKYKARDEIEAHEIGGLLEVIPQWCDHIRDDLYAKAPKYDPLSELREKFKNDIESGIENPDEYFSAEEMENIGVKFDSMFEEISQIKEEFELTKAQLDQVKKDFREFKESAGAYPKGVWARITSNRIIQTLGKLIDTPEGRKLLFEQIKRVLIGGNGE